MSPSLVFVLAEVDTIQPLLFPAIFVVLGLVFGSFIACAVYRVPRGQSLWFPPSQCPQCHTQLQAADLIPVVSWLLFGRKCRHCGVKVPPFYAAIELGSACVALATFVCSPHPLAAFGWLAAALSGYFCVLVWFTSRHLSRKVLLFSFIVVAILLLI